MKLHKNTTSSTEKNVKKLSHKDKSNKVKTGTNKSCNSKSKIGEKIILSIIKIIGIPILIFLFITCLLNRNYITLDGNEQTTYNGQSIAFFVVLTIILTLLVYSKGLLDKISEKKLLIIFSLAYLIGGLYLIFNVDSTLRADADYVYGAAKELNKGDYSALKLGNYIARYPYQLGMVTYDRILTIFCKSPRILFIANLLWTLIINFFLYKIVRLYTKDNHVLNKLTIILSYMFLPQFFFILFAYGTLPGFGCSILTVYFGLKLVKEDFKKLNLCMFFLFASLAILLKNNYMIAIIAITIITILHYCQNHNKYILIIACGLIFTLFLPQKIVSTCYEIAGHTKLQNETPKILWIAMGMQESPSANGWYNGYVYHIPDEEGHAPKKTSIRGQQYISERLNFFKQNPSYTFNFYLNKIRATWNDPMFQSVWSGPLSSEKQQVHTKLLKNIYSGGTVYSILAFISNLVVVIILLFTLIQVILDGKNLDLYHLFSIVFLIGGFLFMIFWEAKSQYVYMFIFCLIPNAVQGISYIQKKL